MENNWILTKYSIPSIDVVVIANVKGYGLRKMQRIDNSEIHKNRGYDPTIWGSSGAIYDHQYNWKEVNSEFICHSDMIIEWKHINITNNIGLKK